MCPINSGSAWACRGVASPLNTQVTIEGPQPPVSPDVISRDEVGRATVRAICLSEPLRLDGRLGESVYQVVRPIDDLIQQIPDEGMPATEKTEVWVMFDERHIYVAARCWDSAGPAEWVANELRRDTTQLRQNDTFGVLLDTFYDRRNAVGFYTNPMGAIADFALTDEGNVNRNWNPVWDVRTGRFEGGWTVEMAIPFKSLRYRPGKEQLWGIQFRRVLRRRNEEAFLTPLPASAAGRGFARVSAAATLVGLDLPPVSRNFELKPYAISRWISEPNGRGQPSERLENDIGLDSKYGLTSGLTADLTYNTDFAQVEVDEQAINLTRFNLFYPEKREFFLEGQGIFDFGRGVGFGTREPGIGPLLFFSRRIGLNEGRAVPIEAGGRLTGKVGKFGVGLLDIQTGEEPLSNAQRTHFTVVRAKRDVLRRSSIGAIFTNRSVSELGPGSNQAFGVDAAFSFFQDVNLGGYVARTRTPGLKRDDISYESKFEYTGDRYGVELEHLVVGENFNPEVGFIRRDDFRRSFGLLRFSPRPQSIRSVRKFEWEVSLDYIVSGADSLESRRQQARFGTEFESSDRLSVTVSDNYELLVEPFTIHRGVLIQAGGYSFKDLQTSYSFGAQRRVSGTVSFQRGGFYGGEITSLTYSRGRISVTPQLSLEPSFSLNWVAVPRGEFTAGLVRQRVDYAFTPRMFVSALFQYSSAEKSFGTNIRLRWEYRPGSELFVVYTGQRTSVGDILPVLNERAFAIKVTRLLRF